MPGAAIYRAEERWYHERVGQKIEVTMNRTTWDWRAAEPQTRHEMSHAVDFSGAQIDSQQ